MSNVLKFKRVSDKKKDGMKEIIDELDLEGGEMLMLWRSPMENDEYSFLMFSTHDEMSVHEIMAVEVLADHMRSSMFEIEEE